MSEFIMDFGWRVYHPNPSKPAFVAPAGAVDAHCHVGYSAAGMATLSVTEAADGLVQRFTLPGRPSRDRVPKAPAPARGL